ncbi:MAG: type II toxin-antitoxin system prevent-host-death family antitoxin [Mycobacteriales bacterium]
MPELSIREARNDLAEVVNRAAYRDEVTYVVRRGKPVAAVVPAEAAQTRAQAEAAAVVMAAADRAARDAANRSAAVVADLRRELAALAEEHARCGTGAPARTPPRPSLPEGNDPAWLRLRTVAALSTLDGTLRAVRTEVESGRWQQATHEAERLSTHVESLRGLLAALTG